MDENSETVKEDIWVKSETAENVTLEKKPLIKDLFSQLSSSINELTFTTSKAIELAQKFSDTLEEKEVSEQICSPLKSAFESFGASLKALQFAGKAFYGIEEDSKDILYNFLKVSEIKNETENDISVMYDELDGIDGLGDYDQSMEEEKESEGEFECDHCEFRTTEARYLKYHKQSSHEVGRFKCEECDYLAHKPYMMKSHMTNKHNKEKIEYLCERENMDIKHYVCQHCHYLNTDKSKLESHMERKHINDPNENVVQKKTKKSKKDSAVVKLEDKESAYLKKEKFDDVDNDRDLSAENIEDEGQGEDGNGTVYQCSRCDYSTTKKFCFEDHIMSTRKYLKCPWCDIHFKFDVRGKLGDHISSAHGIQKVEEKWMCPDCGDMRDNVKELIKHLAKIHNFGTMFHCQQCNYSSYIYKNFSAHSKDHDEASFPCPQCPHLAKSKHRLTKHIYDVHKLQERKILMKDEPVVRPVCDICAESFSTKGALKTHIKGMHTNEEVSCKQCDYVTKNHQNLKHHMLTRHEEKKFLCTQCDFITAIKPNLDAHIKKVHENVRFICDVCDKEFTSCHTLKRHKSVKHTNDAAKFYCSEDGCSYSTHSTYNLRVHVEKVHQGIKWPCDMCDYVGGYKGDLNRHKKIAH